MVRKAYSSCTNGDSIAVIFLSCKQRTAKEPRTFLTSLCHYTLTLGVLPRVSPHFWKISALYTKHFEFPIWGEDSTSLRTTATNCRTTTFLLALGPRKKKDVGCTNNRFFLGRAALCTGGKVVTLGRELQHAAQPDSWLGFPSSFLFVITNIL